MRRGIALLLGLMFIATGARGQSGAPPGGHCTPSWMKVLIDCPTATVRVPDEALRACTGDVLNACATADRASGNFVWRDRRECVGPMYETHEFAEEWSWQVSGVEVTPSAGSGRCASFTNLTAGHGSVTFVLEATDAEFPQCNRRIQETKAFSSHAMDLRLPRSYLGLDLTGPTGKPPDRMTVYGRLEPDIEDLAYQWTLEGTCAFGEPAPGVSDTEATVVERGVPSAAYEGERLTVGKLCAPRTERFTVVRVNVEMGVPETEEESPGARVCLNANDSDESGGLDLDERPLMRADPDLKPVTITVEPANLPQGHTVQIEASGSVYADARKRVQAGSSYAVSSFPLTLYVEGTDAGGALLAQHLPSGAKDRVVWTAMDVDLSGPALFDPDPGQPAELEEERSGHYVVLNDDDDSPAQPNQTWDLRDAAADKSGDTRLGTLEVDVPEDAESVRLDWTTPGRLAVYKEEGGIWEPLNSGATFDAANLPRLKVEGVETGGVMGEVRMSLTAAQRGCECSDEIAIGVVSVDLDGDSNLDGVLTDADDEIEGDDDHGVIVMVNDNDSDGDQVPDHENTRVDGGSDLAEMTVLKVGAVLPADLPRGTVTLSGADQVRVFDAAGNIVKPAAGDAAAPRDLWPDLPATLHAEGVLPGKTTLKLTYRHPRKDGGEIFLEDEIVLWVLAPRVVPDRNHDRVIDARDAGVAAMSEPFRFWINDDRDFGDVSDDESDIPGEDPSGNFKPNYYNGRVDGRSDLIDFFPVWLDLGETLKLLPPNEGVQYKLRQADSAVKAVYTDLSESRAGDYLTKDGSTYGPAFDQDSFEADTFKISSSGVVLDEEFLARIVSDEHKGVLILEGAGETTQPLVLEVWKDGAKVCEKEMPMRLSGVEQMYRWINLRNFVGGAVSRETDPAEPSNPPNALVNGRNFVFVHGYSVDEQAARGWNAEIFKRLYWSGSRAMFHAVTWFGNDSQKSWLGGRTPDYHVNVVHALDTARALASNINYNIGGDITLAAHSLGNMLSSAAIAKHGGNVSRFFMIDAAVAIEAFDGSPSLQDNNMWYTDWDSFGEWLWCSEWYTNFPSGDGRHALTWRDYFGSGASVAYNFYSSGEDVLKTHPHTTYPGLWCVFGGEYAWALQEKRKGLNWISSIGGSTYGGWGFNDYYYDYDLSAYVPPTNAQAILSGPFFRPGGSELEDLYVPIDTNLTDVGSAFATNNLHFLLAGFIPSRTLPMGANRLTTWPTTRNYNMQHTDVDEGFQNGWPRSSTDWLHSDLREVAYLYVYRLYDQFRDLGGLSQP